MKQILAWLRVPENRAVALILGGVIATLTSAGWTAYLHFSKAVVSTDTVNELVLRANLFGIQATVSPDIAYELESLVNDRKFEEAIDLFHHYPRLSCAIYIKANIEWLLDPTKSTRREIRIYKASAKRRGGGVFNTSWGDGRATSAKSGKALEAIVEVAFSDRKSNQVNMQKLRLQDDGSIQVVLLDWGGYSFTLVDPLCLNRNFFTGTMREVNGVSRVVVMLDRLENGRSIERGN